MDPAWEQVSRQVTPHEVWEAYQKQARIAESPLNPIFLDVCLDAHQEGQCTTDNWLYVHVKELTFPGDRKLEEPKDKWLYVLESKSGKPKPIAEVYVDEEGNWLYGDPGNPKHQAKKFQTPYFPLDPGIAEPVDYYFFISPFRLTTKGLKIVVDHARIAAVCVSYPGTTGIHETHDKVSCDVVGVPDPFSWAIAAHQDYFVPFLELYQHWVVDDDRQAKLFIAMILKAVIDAGDAPGIADNWLRFGGEFRGGAEPAVWIGQYEKREKELRESAERAHDYLRLWVRSYWHRAVEASAQEAGEGPLAEALAHWALVVDRILETEPGRVFAMNLCNDEERLVRQYIFPMEPPEAPMGEWSNLQPSTVDAKSKFTVTRRSYKLTLKAFTSVLPAMLAAGKSPPPPAKEVSREPAPIENYKKATPPLDAYKKNIDREEVYLRRYLENLDIKTRGVSYRLVHRNLISGRQPLEGINIDAQRRAENLYLGSYRKLIEEAEKAAQDQRAEDIRVDEERAREQRDRDIRAEEEKAIARRAEDIRTEERRVDEVNRRALENYDAKRTRTQKFFDQLDAKFNMARARVPEDVRRFASRVAVTTSGVLEVVNFAWGLHQYFSEPRSNERKQYSLLGWQVSMELLKHVVQPSSQLLEFAAQGTKNFKERVLVASGRTADQAAKHLSVRALGGTAAFAGMVAGTIELLSSQKEYVYQGMAENDMNVKIGSAMRGFGATLTVIGGGLLLAKSVSGGALFGGPWGAIIGFVGGGLIMAGGAVAAWLKRTELEKYAQLCFLGELRDSENSPAESCHKFWWSPVRLGAGPAIDEARSLVSLVSNFTIKAGIFDGGCWLMIEVGYLPDEGIIEILVDNDYSTPGPLSPSDHFKTLPHWQMHSFLTAVSVDLLTEKISIAGQHKEPSNVRFLRQEDGRLTGIFLLAGHWHEQPAIMNIGAKRAPPLGSLGKPFSSNCYVRLQLPNGDSIPNATNTKPLLNKAGNLTRAVGHWLKVVPGEPNIERIRMADGTYKVTGIQYPAANSLRQTDIVDLELHGSRVEASAAILQSYEA
ncbi:hypothetical protein [Desulfosarcina ovata]|uniref:hypothetical protein n=1 Tax=Desulfosarcina ovata TaxID=83564 RepID=UPI0012D2A3E3|nr:hypothetical protein [Desulfosarcina ovata]